MDRYEEALERARAGMPIDDVFPELKESEDEKIRKELWEYFHDLELRSDRDFSPSFTMDDILAWLERQKGKMTAEDYVAHNWPADKDNLAQELSEEDEKMRKKLIQHFTELKKYGRSTSLPDDDVLAYLERQKEPRDYRKLYEEVVKSDWFKENYAGKFLGEEQKPAEWSEEDEKWFKEIELMALSFSNSADYRSKFLNWLKSIRLKLHWKPNEYTLSLVKKVANGEMLTQMEQMAMGTLYDELQKLL